MSVSVSRRRGWRTRSRPSTGACCEGPPPAQAHGREGLRGAPARAPARAARARNRRAVPRSRRPQIGRAADARPARGAGGTRESVRCGFDAVRAARSRGTVHPGRCASQLSSVAKQGAREAVESRREIIRLFDLSRDILLTTESDTALPAFARHVARRFKLEAVAIACRRRGDGRAPGRRSYSGHQPAT